VTRPVTHQDNSCDTKIHVTFHWSKFPWCKRLQRKLKNYYFKNGLTAVKWTWLGFRVYFSLFSPQKDNAESSGPEFKLIKYPSNKLPFVQFYNISYSKKGKKRFCRFLYIYQSRDKTSFTAFLGYWMKHIFYVSRKSNYLLPIIFRRFGPSIRQNVDFEIRFSFCFWARDKNWFSFGVTGNIWGCDNIPNCGPLLTLSCTCSIGFQPINRCYRFITTVLFTWLTTYYGHMLKFTFLLAKRGSDPHDFHDVNQMNCEKSEIACQVYWTVETVANWNIKLGLYFDVRNLFTSCEIIFDFCYFYFGEIELILELILELTTIWELMFSKSPRLH